MKYENQIIHGDCLEVMEEISPNSIDAIVTDPPFGIGYTYDGEKEKFDEPEGYWNWLQPRYEEMKRVLKKGGFLAVRQSEKYMKYFWGWFGGDIHIYVGAKNRIIKTVESNPIDNAYDPIVMRYVGDSEPLKPSRQFRSVDFFVANTAKWRIQTDSLASGHPCPMPIDLTVEIIRNFVINDALVLDPFLGSGTTAVACKRLNRKFVGIEIKEKYVQIARERVKKQEEPIENYL